MRILNIYRLSLILLFILAFGAGLATFLENFYDTQTAKVLVYEALWYECVMFACTICLAISIIKTKMYKKFGAFLIHLAFIVIFIGAALTRYFGEEGVMHLRTLQSSNVMQSVKPYLIVEMLGENFSYPLKLSLFGKNDFEFKNFIDGKEFIINLLGYKKDEKNAPATLSLEISFNGEKKSVKLKGGAGYELEPSVLSFGGQEVKFYFSSKALNLPCINYTFKNIAEELNISFEEVLKRAKKDFSFDKMVDKKQIELASASSCVLGSRLAIWLLKSADLRVYLRASIDVRAKRIQKREGGDIQKIKADTDLRDMEDTRRYKELYGINNTEYENADLIIDTDHIGPELIVEKILEALYKKGLLI